ncbi:YeaC family protein [Litorivicinus sp.]|jgi:uncharacterized protein YeaC (DUF1315 family)|nr:YeaC family protein [Litorivicinus sp.]|tara:strand:+ start:9158 stop:9424 length:267 start_codon:yes stop_codon:yes gene_type:complete
MNTVEDLVAALTPDIVEDLRRAIETGKYRDGRDVPTKQKELLLEAIIRYDALYLPDQQRTGFIDRSKSSCRTLDESSDLIPTKDETNE